MNFAIDLPKSFEVKLIIVLSEYILEKIYINLSVDLLQLL